jgi:hypothetical protein
MPDLAWKTIWFDFVIAYKTKAEFEARAGSELMP